MPHRSAKVTRPRPAAVIPRPRLFRTLDRLRRAGPALWVSGQPGSGKTTLVATWLAARRLPSAWLRLDAADAELATFFRYLGLAVGVAGRRAPAPVLVPGGDPAAAARSHLRALFARLRSGTALVLDDCHELPPDAPLFRALRGAIEDAAPRVTLVLVGRGPPPPALARPRAHGSLGVLDARALDLTPAEGIALARARGVAAPRGRVEALRRLAHGWTAGLALLLQGTGGSADDPELRAATFDYFAGEVFDGLEPASRRLLLEAALLDAPTASLVEQATGDAGAARVLAALARRGLFTLRHDGADPAFELHALFRAFLLERGRADLPPGRAAAVRRAAALALAARSGPEAEGAVALLVGAGAFDDAARIVAREAPRMLGEGRAVAVEELIARLPAPLREGDPWLLLWGGAALVGRSSAATTSLLERALAEFERRADAAGVWLSWATLVEATLHAWTDFAPLERRLAELEPLRARLPFPSPEIELRVLLAALAALVHHAPDHPAAAAWATAAEAVALREGEPRTRLNAGAILNMWAVWWHGDVARGRRLVAALAPLARARRVDPVAAIHWLATEGPLHVVAGDDAVGARAVLEARRLAEASGVRTWDVALHSQAIWGALGRDDVADARAHLARVAAAARPGCEMDLALVRAFEAAVALRAGDDLDALRRAGQAKELGERLRHPVVHVFADLVVARAAARAEPGGAAAEEALASARAKIARIGSRCFGHVLALAEADRELRRGDPAAATEPLARALALADAGAAHARYLFSRAERATLLAAALERGVGEEVALRVVRAERLPAPEEAGRAWPWPVSIAALGPFRLAREGAAVTAGSRARRPIELARALVALGGREVPETALEEALWPDADGDAAHHALETTLYRLRRLVGQDAVVASRGRLSLAPGRCFVDAFALDRRLRASAAMLERGSPAPARLREDAAVVIDLYRGPLLDGVDAPWAAGARDRLRVRLERWLAAVEVVPGDPAGAAALRRALVSADPRLGEPRERRTA